MPHEVVVVGAGVAGLSLAKTLSDLGLRPLVLERARGVGGRAATRRLDGEPVDHGLPFFHGSDPEFVATLNSVAQATPLPGWPVRRVGNGYPCQPEAFQDGALLAYREGATRLPKHLARGVEVRLESEVVSIAAGDGAVEARLATGERIRAPFLVLTPPVPEALRLLAPVAVQSPALAALIPALELVQTVATLVAIARYPAGVAPPPWDIALPIACDTLHAVIHDSAKRGAATATLVLHGRAAFSRAHAAGPPEAWSQTLLDAAAESFGDWIRHPAVVVPHRWEHARVRPPSELAGPVLITLESGGMLGLAGDGLGPGRGVEGAFRSGRLLAHRIAAARRSHSLAARSTS